MTGKFFTPNKKIAGQKKDNNTHTESGLFHEREGQFEVYSPKKKKHRKSGLFHEREGQFEVYSPIDKCKLNSMCDIL